MSEDRVRAAEIIAALSLATDLGIGTSLEYGLHSTLFAMRLVDLMDLDVETASHTYYACLLFYVGCTANADVAAEIFGEDNALTTYGMPHRFGSRPEMMRGFMRAIAPPGRPLPIRAVRVAQKLPKVAAEVRTHVAEFCEVAKMLTDRLGLPTAMQPLFAYFSERWDGKGEPGAAKGEEIPLPVRIVQVARDAAFQRMLGGAQFAADVVRKRAGGAFDPVIAGLVAEEAVLALDEGRSAWEETLAVEPKPWPILEDEAIDEALAAVGDFADLVSPYLVGHSRGVADLAAAAGELCGFEADDVCDLRRAALVHDVGRVAVPARIWQHAAPLSPDDWECVRLHAYHTERILQHSPFLAGLAKIAATHHERLDGSGYHRGTLAASLPSSARLLAAADAYHAMAEPRPHRPALSPKEATETLAEEAQMGRLDAESVNAVLEASGHPVPRIKRPAGLTEREVEVVGLLARGLQTKQVARALGISPKTADRHIQNAYAKIGVSTRAAVALFAMEHGLVAWGGFPISGVAARH